MWHLFVQVRLQASQPMQFSAFATDITLLPMSSPYSSSPSKGFSISSSTSRPQTLKQRPQPMHLSTSIDSINRGVHSSPPRVYPLYPTTCNARTPSLSANPNYGYGQ